MNEPIFWLGISLLLVAISLTAVLVTALPAVLALANAARSMEKLTDTLTRELPPTLEAIRLTGLEISELTDDVNQSVQTATEVVKKVDQSLGQAKQQVKQVKHSTRNLLTGVRVAWQTFRGRSPVASIEDGEAEITRYLPLGMTDEEMAEDDSLPEDDIHIVIK